MLDHYTTPGESIEIRDNQTIYSLLTDRLARTGADTVIAAKKIGPGRWQNVTTGEFQQTFPYQAPLYQLRDRRLQLCALKSPLFRNGDKTTGNYSV